MREYDLIADWYATERVDDTGVAEVLALAASLPSASLVLDIGCGNGVPLTRALLNAGHRVVGLDTSSNMLTRFARNCPDAAAVRGDIRACPFRDASFDAALAWGVMFHLPPPEEVRAIANLSRLLKPGAPFLFTSGDADGCSDDHVGVMNGVTFHYYSFTAIAYADILREHGLALLDTHKDRGGNFYYLAVKFTR